MCAVAVLAVAIVGLTSVAATSAAVHRAGIQKNAAMRSIEKRIATISSTAFANILATYNNRNFDEVGIVGVDSVNGSIYGGASATALDALATDGDHEPGRITVTVPTGANAAELLEVLLQVVWQSPCGPETVTRRVRLSRLGTS